MDCTIVKELTRSLNDVFKKAINDKVTPGAVVAVCDLSQGSSEKIYVYSCGYTSNLSGKEKVASTTVFDLASLTKPLVTFLCLLNLVQHRVIDRESTLVELLPHFKIPEDKKNIRLWQLMSHCSGFPAHRPYFVDALALKKSVRKDYFIQSLLAEKLEYLPGSRHVYSDLGYILLGVVVEQLSQKSLDAYVQESVLKPLGLGDKLFFRSPTGKLNPLNYAVTEICPWTHTLLAGVVHDDNCRVMGGVAGHAGLFGTAGGVIDICNLLCEVWQGVRTTELFSRDTLRTFLTKVDGSSWTCGFDTPSTLTSSSGGLFSRSSVGHLGFTGTSMWIDLERGISVVLLTNRVHQSRKNENHKKLRPEVHDIIMGKLLNVKKKSPLT